DSEALASARLTHPNIVNVYDTGSENGMSFLVMELVDGVTLDELLRRSGPLEPDRAVAILVPVLQALDCAHSNGVVPRAVTPGRLRPPRHPRPPVASRPGVPRTLEAVVIRAMARRPGDRYQTAENMAAALIRVGGPVPISTAPQRAAAIPAQPRSHARAPGAF